MASRASVVDRLLKPFSKIRPGEGPIAALMLVCVFLILTSYYLMKPAREGLILAGGAWGLHGDELKTYATGVMALVLVVVVPAYGALANRMRRMRLINISYAVVIGSLIVFFGLARAGAPIGLTFFVWLGLVSVFLIGQFWSYANDIYTEEQGKRLFAVIAVGGSLGAIFGPRIAKLADTYTLLVLAAIVLAACLVLFNIIEHIHSRQTFDIVATEPISGAGGFQLVVRDRYLLLIACMMLVANVVNTTGEYVLSNATRVHAMQLAPGSEAVQRELIKQAYSDFFSWVNIVAFVVQALLVSRIIQKVGVRAALFVLPIVAFGAYGLIGTIGTFSLVRVAKVAENSTDYSLQNTVRQTLFLPTERAVKYKAKAAIDTFFVRIGDTMSAVMIGVGIHELGLGGRQFALVSLVLVALWIALAIGITRRHRGMSHNGSDARA